MSRLAVLILAFATCRTVASSNDCCAPPLERPPPGLVWPLNSNVKVSEEHFGEVDGKPVNRYTLTSAKMTVQVMNYGAYLMSVRVPDKKGKIQDLVLGYDNLARYLNTSTLIGAIVGRVANRISDSTFTLNGKQYHLNHLPNHPFFHGGTNGWSKMVWNASVLADGVTLSLLSPDGDEHFPGTVHAQVSYRLTADNDLLIAMKAVTDQPTPINVYSHCFFNLAGHDNGPKGINETAITIYASQYYPLDKDSIPLGKIEPVSGTDLNFCTPRLLGDVLARRNYDDIYILSRCKSPTSQMLKIGRAVHKPSGRTLELYSDQPHMEFYTANGLPDPSRKDQTPVVGKGGVQYQKHGGFLFIPQNFYDKHVKSVPSNVLAPGVVYHNNMLYKFGVQ